MKKQILFLAIHVLSLFIAIRFAAVALVEFIHREGSEERLQFASNIMPGNAVTYHYLGIISQNSLIYQDKKKAVDYYKSGLQNNPFSADMWRNLAKTYLTLNQRDLAFEAAENAYNLNQNDPGLLWDLGILYLLNSDQKQKGMQFFKQYIEIMPREQSKVFDLCDTLQIPFQDIALFLLANNPNSYSAYLKYLMKYKTIHDVTEFYNIYASSYIDQDTAIDFCNYLINNRYYDTAKHVWNRILKKTLKDDSHSSADNLVYNGSFERTIIKGCFGWNIGRSTDAYVYMDSEYKITGLNSLAIYFTGKGNPYFNAASQIISVKPRQEYLFQANIKSEGLTTRNGLFFSISGYNCKGLAESSEVITGTNPWKSIKIPFSVPMECNMIAISLVRAKSNKLNNKIKGTAWIDDIRLIKLDRKDTA